MLIGSAEAGRRAGLRPRGRIRSMAVIGSEPTIMLTGPAPSCRKALAKAGMAPADIDLWEVKLHLTGFADRKLTLKPGADAAYMQTLKPKRGKKGDKGKSDGKNQDHK